MGTTSYKSIDELSNWVGNYRHSDLGAIIQSILKFGYNWPVAVDSAGVVRAGNHRVKALRELQRQGWQPEGACIRVNGNGWEILTVNLEHLTEQEQLAFAIADNRTSELASNDEETLVAYLQELAAEDEKLLAATGYDGDDIDALLFELNPRFDPVGMDEQPRLDELQPIICPHCGKNIRDEA